MDFRGQQAPSGRVCTLPAPEYHSNKPNMFNDRQEQWVGDAQAAQTEPMYDLVPEKDSAELERIGQKLLAQLPPTPIHYHFRVFEAEDANAFSLAGGYVYVSRKLITDAHSEDEIAGVLAHEIGHIYTHQIAISFTRMLKVMLGVTSVGSREDVEDKMQLLLNVNWKEKAGEEEGDAERDELLADRVGLYAMARAGYAPKAFSENLDRVTANKGHTGNFLTDALGTTSEINLRVRVARKAADSLPESCGQSSFGSSPEFKVFQEAIRNVRVHPLIEATPGLTSFKLNPPMPAALSQVLFSPDGKYVLAQNENNIHVLSRSPLKLLFSIDAPGAQLAHFSPDSTHVTFHYQTMRVENWEIATGKRESFHELVDYEGCPQTSLSPDGKTFVCLALTHGSVWLKLSDVETGKRFYDNKNFYEISSAQSPELVFRYIAEPGIGTVAYSQDSRFLTIATGIKSVAFDLSLRKQIQLEGGLNHLFQGRTAFVDSDKLIFDCDWGGKFTGDLYTLCETKFPSGDPMNTFKLGEGQWIWPVTRGNHLLIGPLRDNAAVLIDPSTGKPSMAFKLDSLDVYDNMIASETERGAVAVGELGGQHMDSVDLPVSPLRGSLDADFSLDGRFLAYSGRTRSSIWDLNAQKLVGLMRPFDAVDFDDQDQMIARYPKSHQKPGQNSMIDLKTGKVTEGPAWDRDQFLCGGVLVKTYKTDKKGNVESTPDMQVVDPATGAKLWSKKFPNGMPIVRRGDGDSLLLVWDYPNDEANREKNLLVKASDKKGEWVERGLLVEVVGARTGELRRKIVVPERGPEDGSADRRGVSLYGDYLVVRGNQNNSVIYRITDGQRISAFYGHALSGDGKLRLIAATNHDQEVTFLDAATGKIVKQVTLDHFPRAARFVSSKNALLVLTATQRVYSIDLPAAGHSEPELKK
jgi:WD40 repeat protein